MQISITSFEEKSTKSLKDTLVKSFIPCSLKTNFLKAKKTNKSLSSSSKFCQFFALGFFLFFLSVLSACQCEMPTTPEPNLSATNITINGGDFISTNGNTGTLTATVLPTNHVDGDVRWQSSHPNVFAISPWNGEYTSRVAGTVTVTASLGNIFDEITVNVRSGATNIIINEGSFVTNNGIMGILTATVLPSNHVSGSVSWKSDMVFALDILSNNLNSVPYRTMQPGAVTVTATVGDLSTNIIITINSNATNILINTSSNIITVTNDEMDNSGVLTATTLPSPNNSSIVWSSSDITVLTISNSNGRGVYTPISRGASTVTATAGIASHSITVNVHQAATNITITNGNITINNGISNRLIALVLPTNHQDGAVTWSSTDANSLIIDAANGSYRSLNAGLVSVTARVGQISNSISVSINSNATNISIATNTFSVITNTNGTLNVVITPTYHTNGSNVIWTSSDTNVVTVDSNGQYTSINGGRSTVLAELGSLSDSVDIIVASRLVTNISITGGNLSVTNGTNGTLTATVLPSDQDEGILVWMSSATNIVSINVSNGNWSAVNPGQATITATVGSRTDTITIDVLEPATNIIINGGDFTIDRGLSNSLAVTILPTNHTDGNATWMSDDTNKLIIDANGNYRTLSPGTVEVTAMVGIVSNSITITINSNATNIVINTNDFTVTIGGTGTLTATAFPSGHNSGNIVWKSANTNVFTINSNSGSYTAVAPGTNIITAVLGKLSNSISVIVISPASNIAIDTSSFVNLGNKTVITTNGASGILSAMVLPTNHTDGAITWVSSNTNVLAISGVSGAYNFINTGTAEVTASVGGVSDTITFNVFDMVIPATNITITNTFTSLNLGTSNTLRAVVLPTNHSYGEVVWSSSDSNVLTLLSVTNNNDGSYALFRGDEIGTSTVTARVGDVSTNVAVTVNIPATNVTIDQGTNIAISNVFITNLTITVLPANHTDSVAWNINQVGSFNNVLSLISSDRSSASYNITGAGDARVSVSVGNITKDTLFRVANLDVTNLTFESTTVANYSTGTLRGILHPDGFIVASEYNNFLWTSSNSNRLEIVSNTGAYRAYNTGTVNVNLTWRDTSITSNFTVAPPVFGSRAGVFDFYLHADNNSTVNVVATNNRFYVLNNSGSQNPSVQNAQTRIYVYGTNGSYLTNIRFNDTPSAFMYGFSYYDGHFYISDVSSGNTGVGNPVITNMRVYDTNGSRQTNREFGFQSIRTGLDFPSQTFYSRFSYYLNGFFYLQVDENLAGGDERDHVYQYNTNGVLVNVYHGSDLGRDIIPYNNHFYISYDNETVAYTTNFIRLSNMSFNYPKLNATRAIFYHNQFFYVVDDLVRLARAFYAGD